MGGSRDYSLFCFNPAMKNLKADILRIQKWEASDKVEERSALFLVSHSIVSTTDRPGSVTSSMVLKLIFAVVMSSEFLVAEIFADI